MTSEFYLVLLLGVFSAQPCPPLTSPHYGSVTCVWRSTRIRCGSHTPTNSIATFTCQEFYKLEGKMSIKCRRDGSWSENAPTCIPDCGRRSNSVSLVVNGAVAPRGAYPWHVAIYNRLTDGYEYWCGGSLISQTAVITAAHCTWQIPIQNLFLVFGKHHRDYNMEENSQKIKAKKIEILDTYQDVVGNYNGDIAVVILEKPVTLGHYSAPACIDWDQNLTEKHLSEGSEGVALGWGLTETGNFSDLLRVVRLPAVSAGKCIKAQEGDFKKFITCTSFCAGFLTGVGVCNGDSGGGLVFFDDVSERWFIQGVVSVSPRKKGTPYCNPNSYTVFTRVSMFSKWLKTVLE